MSSISTPSCAHVILPIPPMPPSSQANTLATSSSSTARCKRTLSSTSSLSIVRWTILIISSVCLILDIISIQALLSRPHFFHGPPLTAPQPDQNSQPPKPSFFSLLIFRLLPDIMVMSLMSMLLWRRIRLPNHLWSLHTLCRILFSTAIMVFALIYPITELRLVLEQNQGWAIYFCQIRPPPPPQWGSDLRGVLLVSKGTIASRPLDGSLQTQDSWAQNCAVLRARSVLTVMWVLLILVEICIAYRAKEFQSRDDLCSKHGHWSKARIDRLIKASMDSSSEVWSEEIVRPHNDDNDEVDVRGNYESDYDYDYDYEETSTQYDLGQQRRSLQEHRYSHPPPEYHYAYRVEVLEPALPPFVYNPFLRQSDCSFACLDMADSITTGSSITISSIDSLDSSYGPYRTQNSEVSRPRHHGCL